MCRDVVGCRSCNVSFCHVSCGTTLQSPRRSRSRLLRRTGVSGTLPTPTELVTRAIHKSLPCSPDELERLVEEAERHKKEVRPPCCIFILCSLRHPAWWLAIGGGEAAEGGGAIWCWRTLCVSCMQLPAAGTSCL